MYDQTELQQQLIFCYAKRGLYCSVIVSNYMHNDQATDKKFHDDKQNKKTVILIITWLTYLFHLTDCLLL